MSYLPSHSNLHQILAVYNKKIYELSLSIHTRLVDRFSFIQEERQLSDDENDLLYELSSEAELGLQYKNLVGLLAIDTFTKKICTIFNEADTLLEILSICLNCAVDLKQQISVSQKLTDLPDGEPRSQNKLYQSFSHLFESILNMTECARELNPTSPYLELYESIIKGEQQSEKQKSSKHLNSAYHQLKEENQELKDRLKLSDSKIIELEVKLQKILQELSYQEKNGSGVENTVISYELREELARKNNQIQKMGHQFGVQIQKYNVVYAKLKQQLEEYKTYENVNTVEVITQLETEIVRFREEAERDSIIIEELRRRLYSDPVQNSGKHMLRSRPLPMYPQAPSSTSRYYTEQESISSRRYQNWPYLSGRRGLDYDQEYRNDGISEQSHEKNGMFYGEEYMYAEDERKDHYMNVSVRDPGYGSRASQRYMRMR